MTNHASGRSNPSITYWNRVMVSSINLNPQLSLDPSSSSTESVESLRNNVASVKNVDISKTSNPHVCMNEISEERSFSFIVTGRGNGADNFARKEPSRHQQRVERDAKARAAVFGQKKEEKKGPFSQTKALAQQSEDYQKKRAAKAAARKAEKQPQQSSTSNKPGGVEGVFQSLDKNGKKLNDFVGVLKMFK